MNTPMTRKAWLEYLQKAVDEFDWDAAYKEESQRQWVDLTRNQILEVVNAFYKNGASEREVAFAREVQKACKKENT